MATVQSRRVPALLAGGVFAAVSACTPITTRPTASEPGATAGAASATLGAGATRALAQPNARLERAETCFVELPEDLDPKVQVDCGYVVVPEFHDAPSSRELKLGYVRFNAIGATEGPPLMELAGGPGQSNLGRDSFPLMAPHLLGRMLAERDVVFLEQRGTEHTDTFLDCPEYHRLQWVVFDEELDHRQAIDRSDAVLRRCVEGFRARGINLDAYNSVENAADVAAASRALGYSKIIYYGASYGAQLGQHVMRDHPDVLAGVVLDGANALERKSWVEDRALDAQYGIDHLAELCKADAKCAATYDIPALVDAALGLFDAGPMSFSYTDPNAPGMKIEGELTKQDMVSFIFSKQGTHIGAMALPAVLWLLTRPENTAMAAEAVGEWKATALLASRNGDKGSVAILMHYAIVCSDDPVKSVDELVVEGMGEYATMFGRDVAEDYVRACAILKVRELPDETDVNVNTDVPTLLLAGHLDVSTPEYRTKSVADNLPRATMVVFPDGTHVQVAGANSCALDLLVQFSHDPGAPLDLKCVAERPVLGFVLPDDLVSAAQD